MTAHTIPQSRTRRAARKLLLWPIASLVVLVLAAGIFVSYVLWPTWPGAPVPLDAPAVPITVAGVLFDVPPAAIRAAVQRHPGPHERIDLAFLWPSLTPPQPDAKSNDTAAPQPDQNAAAETTDAMSDRLFVTIARLGSVLRRSNACEIFIRATSRHKQPQGPMGSPSCVSQRHALSERRPRLFRCQSRAVFCPLHAPRPCRAGHLHRRARRRRRRNHAALSARVAERLARRRCWVRPAYGAVEAARKHRLTSNHQRHHVFDACRKYRQGAKINLAAGRMVTPDRWPESPSGNCRSARRPRHRRTARR